MVERGHVIAVSAHDEQTDGNQTAPSIQDAAAHDPLLERDPQRAAEKRQKWKRTGASERCSEPRVANAAIDRIGSICPRLVAADALGADHGTIRLDGFMHGSIDQTQRTLTTAADDPVRERNAP